MCSCDCCCFWWRKQNNKRVANFTVSTLKYNIITMTLNKYIKRTTIQLLFGHLCNSLDITMNIRPVQRTEEKTISLLLLFTYFTCINIFLWLMRIFEHLITPCLFSFWSWNYFRTSWTARPSVGPFSTCGLHCLKPNFQICLCGAVLLRLLS